jgi:hypothetical protein
VITFVHELEHFVQYATLYKVWVVNTVAARIGAEDDEPYWKYFLGLSSQASFDLVAATIPWFDKYRTHFLRVQQSDVDFSKDKWWR